MENDSDYGGTSVMNQEDEFKQMKEDFSTNSYDNIEVDSAHDSSFDKAEGIESLENPDYTDTVYSYDSGTALLEQDQNKIWKKEDDSEKNGKEELLENHLIRLLQPDQNGSEENVECTDTFSGEKKDFEISVVEITPYIPHSLQAEPLMESTAYIDEFTCPSPSTRRLERVCRSAMINLSQDISCKGSLKGSTLLPVLINEVPEPIPMEEESFFEGNEIKNLLVISVSVAFMSVAFNSLRNLQSSLNHEDGVGLYSLTGSCGAFTVLSLFTPSLIQQFRPKRCLIFALFTHLLYVAANVIPEFFILVPASILQGGGAALMWNAVSTYITYLARSTAIRNDKRTVDIAAKYFGIFFCFYQLSVVVGNLISSLVLMQPISANHTISIRTESHQRKLVSDQTGVYNIPFINDTKSEFSICGSNYCHSYPIEHGTINVEGEARYNLLGIYGVATVLSLILPLFLMDTLRNYRTSKVNVKHILRQASSVLVCIINPRFLSCILIFLYSNMELGFVMAEVTKAFVTCPLGIHMVGYTMICFGVCASISSFIGGKIEKHVGCVTLISSATIIDLVLLAVMLVWRPTPDHIFYYFLLLGAWGVGDGIWMSQVNCVISRLFPDQLEAAFAALRVVNGLGITIGFAYATSLCMTSKIYVLLIVCLLGTVVYVISEIIRKRCNQDNDTGELDVKG